MVTIFSKTLSKISDRRNIGGFFNSKRALRIGNGGKFREGFRPLRDWTESDLWILSRQDVWDAHAERLWRNVSYEENGDDEKTEQIVQNIHNDAYRHLSLSQAPYYVSMALVTSICIASIPMTFHSDLVSYFNEHCVTAPLPDVTPDSILEVGSWAWTWIEPMSGTFCFLMLCMSLNRSLMKRAGINPYPNYMLERRIQYIKKKYPKYDDGVLRKYVKQVDRRWYRDDDGPSFTDCGGSNIPEEIWTPNMGGMSLEAADFNIQSLSNPAKVTTSLKMRQKRRKEMREKAAEQILDIRE